MKTALIGCGRWGKNIARVLSELGVLKAIVDPRISKESLRGVYQLPGADYLVKCADDIDAVAIATPSEFHYSLAAQALQAGKHVFVEKPMCMNRREAQDLHRLSLDHRRVLMVGHIMHYHAGFQRLKEEIDPREIRHIRAVRIKNQEPHYQESALWRLAPHDVSMVLGFMREEPSVIRCRTSHSLGYIELEWPVRAVSARIEFGHNYSPPKRTFTVNTYGENGRTYEFNDYVPAEDPEPLKQEMRHFIECIENDRAPITNGGEGERVVRILSLAQERSCHD